MAPDHNQFQSNSKRICRITEGASQITDAFLITATRVRAFHVVLAITHLYGAVRQATTTTTTIGNVIVYTSRVMWAVNQSSRVKMKTNTSFISVDLLYLYSVCLWLLLNQVHGLAFTPKQKRRDYIEFIRVPQEWQMWTWKYLQPIMNQDPSWRVTQ